MTNLDKEIAKFLKSTNFKKMVEQEAATNKAFGGNEDIAKQYANRLKELLQNEVRKSSLVSEETGLYFLDHILTKVYFVNGNGWVAEVFFDEDEVTRDTFSNTYSSAYLPYLINNEWSRSPAGLAWGIDRHGNFVSASDKYMSGEFKGFIQRVVEKFMKEINGNAEIEIDENYDGF